MTTTLSPVRFELVENPLPAWPSRLRILALACPERLPSQAAEGLDASLEANGEEKTEIGA